jgi:hypothetical protein
MGLSARRCMRTLGVVGSWCACLVSPLRAAWASAGGLAADAAEPPYGWYAVAAGLAGAVVGAAVGALLQWVWSRVTAARHARPAGPPGAPRRRPAGTPGPGAARLPVGPYLY